MRVWSFLLALSIAVHALAVPQWLYVRFVPQARPLVQSGSVWLGPHAHVDRVLLRTQQSILEQQNASQLFSSSQRTAIERAEEPLLRTAVVRYDGDVPADKFCNMLMATHSLVEYAEPMRPQRLLFIPNDPLFSQQEYLQAIEAPSAWDITTGSASVLIGVSDSGVRQSHEDLRDVIAINTGETPGNGIDDDGNGYVDDYRGYNFSWREDQTSPDNTFHPTDGHGTNVAGILAATQNNGKGISGIAPGCRIVPLKTSPNSIDGYVLFGYESLIYAALRGCKVVNCSWGNETQAPSPIEQSIIDFAIARDVAIVAAAGNTGNTLPTYPAAYHGVLGVGETDVNGALVSSSGYGAHCRILAPGNDARTTGNIADGNYTTFGGTSSATPMVSAVVGLVRSRYPQLTALQALEHVRLSARDVSSQNAQLAPLLPGMVNAHVALTRDPFSTPALCVEEVFLEHRDGTPALRWGEGDTLQLFVRIVNRLGAGTQVRFTLSAYNSLGEAALFLSILQGSVQLASVSAGEEMTVGPFVIAINGHVTTRHFLRLAIDGRGSGGAQYSDVALVPFYPAPDWVTIERDSTVLSIGDYGWFGLNTGSGLELKGKGLSFAGIGSVLYGGGVIAVYFPIEQVRSGIEADADRFDNDFALVQNKPQHSSTVRILRDSHVDSLGLQLEESIEVLDPTTVRIRSTVYNRSLSPLGSVAVGYFFDFDLTPTGDSSAVSLLMSGDQACAEIIEHAAALQKVVALVRSSDSDVELQCAGLDAAYASVSNFLPERKLESLRRGTGLQQGGLGDKSIVVGARYPNGLAAGERRTFDAFIFAGRNRNELLARAAILSSAIEPTHHKEALIASPHPIVGSEVALVWTSVIGQTSHWQLFSLDGRILWQKSYIVTPEQVVVPFICEAAGVYFVRAISGQHAAGRFLVRLP